MHYARNSSVVLQTQFVLSRLTVRFFKNMPIAPWAPHADRFGDIKSNVTNLTAI
jgi:hypothetical protein